MAYRVWQWIHNCVAHPLEGWVILLFGKSPRWVDAFHDWTASKAYGKK
jgi:hypothetical protein